MFFRNKKKDNLSSESDKAKKNREGVVRMRSIGDDISIERLENKGYTIISENGLEDLKNKQPELYDKIYQEGVSAGKETQNRINASIISKHKEKLKVDSTTTDQKNEPQGDETLLWAWEKGPDAIKLRAQFKGHFASFKADFENNPIRAAWSGKDGPLLKAEFGDDYDSYENFFKNDQKFKTTGRVAAPAY